MYCIIALLGAGQAAKGHTELREQRGHLGWESLTYGARGMNQKICVYLVVSSPTEVVLDWNQAKLHFGITNDSLSLSLFPSKM